eukprot:TRINITY_DN6112_c0_g1_i10.p1 TRINITY_DN6112_c0_g1~~TRINITY_DN6112_c0_g1_i10.p1  ORF type:complete len:145 (-),score=6.94 TRINITY_DN6112_c0_g1_i10:1257-1691(-)
MSWTREGNLHTKGLPPKKSLTTQGYRSLLGERCLQNCVSRPSHGVCEPVSSTLVLIQPPPQPPNTNNLSPRPHPSPNLIENSSCTPNIPYPTLCCVRVILTKNYQQTGGQSSDLPGFWQHPCSCGMVFTVNLFPVSASGQPAPD